jgi:hypothetical protein
MAEKNFFRKLNAKIKERIKVGILLTLLILPVLLYFSAQSSNNALNIVFLGLMLLLMLTIVILG